MAAVQSCKGAIMATQKLYAGAKLREMRTRLGLTQKDFADKLGVSLPYLNQMENNNRPVSTAVVLALAQEFGLDVTELSHRRHRTPGHATCARRLADPVFADAAPPLADLRLAASNAPALARAFLELHRAYRQTHERLASLDEALGREDARSGPARGKRCAISFTIATITSTRWTAPPNISPTQRHTDRSGRGARRRAGQVWAVDSVVAERDALRSYDPDTQAPDACRDRARRATQTVPAAAAGRAADPGRSARSDAGSGAVSDRRGPRHRQDRAGQLLRRRRADALRASFSKRRRKPATIWNGWPRSFGASIEQVAHRLSTLQRPGAKGIPFFFVRVDQAGTITKRHSATRLQFARFGGACPLWNVHQAFETPGRFLRQLAETPDGVRYICLARDVSKSGGSFRRAGAALCHRAWLRGAACGGAWSMPTTWI